MHLEEAGSAEARRRVCMAGLVYAPTVGVCSSVVTLDAAWRADVRLLQHCLVCSGRRCGNLKRCSKSKGIAGGKSQSVKALSRVS